MKHQDAIVSISFSDNLPDNSHPPITGGADYSCDVDHDNMSSSLGFLELLGIQNNVGVSTSPPGTVTDATNSSSLSSESSEELPPKKQSMKMDEEDKVEQRKITQKQLKAKKTNQKKQREPRVAFMTKSEVDHLEDGYRWRKYGQKAVKNSPYPRSYFRCTNASCNVKKRVERSFEDPTVVVTTYEGQHSHYLSPNPNVLSPFPGRSPQSSGKPFPFPAINLSSSTNSSLCTGGVSMASLLRDDGLLQDIVHPPT